MSERASLPHRVMITSEEAGGQLLFWWYRGLTVAPTMAPIERAGVAEVLRQASQWQLAEERWGQIDRGGIRTRLGDPPWWAAPGWAASSRWTPVPSSRSRCLESS